MKAKDVAINKNDIFENNLSRVFSFFEEKEEKGEKFIYEREKKFVSTSCWKIVSKKRRKIIEARSS